MASLDFLPVELVARIGEFTDPFSHLDLACTCRYIFNALQDLFRRHRAAYTQAPCSDVQPLTIPRTLRSVIADPFVAYHIRTIHIWCVRPQWSDWKPVRLSLSTSLVDGILETRTSSTWTFQPDEVNLYLDTLNKYLCNFEEGSELRGQARDELARGCDGVLKALLIVLCPRLRTVYYALTSYVNVEAENGSIGNMSLTWLSRIIISYRDQALEKWPPGLQSLRHLAIGVDTGTGSINVLRHQYSPLFVAKVLNLPNLESFYLCGLAVDDRWHTEHHDDGYPLTPGCSPLRHIYIGNFYRIERETWAAILKACKKQLTSLAFRGDAPEYEYEFIAYAQETAPNLQSIMFYRMPQWRIDGFFYPPQKIISDHELRAVTVVASDIVFEAGHQYNGKGDITRERFTQYLFGGWWGDRAPFPTSLEILVLIGSFRDFGYLLKQDEDVSVEEMMDWFDEALAAMIRATNSDTWRCEKQYQQESLEVGASYMKEPEGDADAEENEEPTGSQKDYEAEVGPQHVYPNLKAIFIEPWGSVMDKLPTASILWLQKSIQAGIERGVDVRTRTNVNQPRHRDLQFHMAPGQFDMQPAMLPPENQQFNPIRGEWVDRGCGNCGNCEECFTLFPRELWAQAYRAPQQPLEDNPRSDGYDPQTEIWTRFTRVIQPTTDCEGHPVPEANLRDELWMERYGDTLSRTLERGIRIQKVSEYARDRRCAVEEIMWTPNYSDFPPIGFPETARQRRQA